MHKEGILQKAFPPMKSGLMVFFLGILVGRGWTDGSGIWVWGWALVGLLLIVSLGVGAIQDYLQGAVDDLKFGMED